MLSVIYCASVIKLFRDAMLKKGGFGGNIVSNAITLYYLTIFYFYFKNGQKIKK